MQDRKTISTPSRSLFRLIPFLPMLLGIFAVAPMADAATLYMSTTGSDTGTCSDTAKPCKTLQYSMTQMKGGDTLLIDDGNYTEAGNAIDQNHRPPSGSAKAMTTIRAKNIPGENGVPVDQPLKVKFTGNATFRVNNTSPTTYVKFQGIRWNEIATYTGWDHIVFKQVAAQGVTDGNTTAITIGGRYNLLEDVVAFGKGRYKVMFYDFTRTGVVGNNLARRVIVRQDWANAKETSKNPIAGFASYYNRGSAFLNTMVIDSEAPQYWMENPGELSGAYYQPVDGGPHAMTIAGSLVLNTAMAPVFTRPGSSGHRITDLAAVKVAGGVGAQGGMDINRLTLSDVGTSNFIYRSKTQEGQVLAANVGVLNSSGSPVSLTNSIIQGVSGPGVKGKSIKSDHIDMSGNAATFTDAGPAPNFHNADPFTSGLLYPARVEKGSMLATAGSAGGQVGARIVNKLGVDGTFKGDPGWDTEQAAPLWPWPLQGWIRAEMRSMDQTIGGDVMPNPARGFCADGQTLTGYVWNLLGKTPPASF